MPPVERIVLPNNLVLLLSEEHSLPFVVFQMLVDAGSRLDPAGKEGLANLTAKGLLLGTSRQNANAINEELDFMGASLNTSAGQDYATVGLQILEEGSGEGIRSLCRRAYESHFSGAGDPEGSEKDFGCHSGGG